MLICLDYDKTYEADPDMFDEFIKLARNCGHEVILATYRDYDFDWTDLMTHLEEDMEVPVYCTGGVAKKWCLSHFAAPEHQNPDIWIDDNPFSILENSKATPEQLKKWRENNEGINI